MALRWADWFCLYTTSVYPARMFISLAFNQPINATDDLIGLILATVWHGWAWDCYHRRWFAINCWWWTWAHGWWSEVSVYAVWIDIARWFVTDVYNISFDEKPVTGEENGIVVRDVVAVRADTNWWRMAWLRVIPFSGDFLAEFTTQKSTPAFNFFQCFLSRKHFIFFFPSSSSSSSLDFDGGV